MHPTTSHTPEVTRQFLAAMCAKANSLSAGQGMIGLPEMAIAAQANLDLKSVLDLLRD